MKYVSPEQEAEIRVMIANVYKSDGLFTCLDCIHTMQEIQLIILTKLNEIAEEENGH